MRDIRATQQLYERLWAESYHISVSVRRWDDAQTEVDHTRQWRGSRKRRVTPGHLIAAGRIKAATSSPLDRDSPRATFRGWSLSVSSSGRLGELTAGIKWPRRGELTMAGEARRS